VSLKTIFASKPIVLTCLGILVPVGIGLAYYELRIGLPPALQALLPIVYVALIVLLLRTGVIPIPDQYRRPLLGGRIHVPDLAKSIGCFLASLLWVAVVVRLVSDTPVGAAVVFTPALLILGGSAFFFARSFSRRSR